MSKFKAFLLAALLVPVVVFAQGGVFDPTGNPCDSDIHMPGCIIR